MLTFRTHKERALLSYILVENGKSHRRDDLADFFWPDRSDTVARNNLRQALFGIRQAIGEAGFEAIFDVTNDEIKARLSDKLWLDLAAYDVHVKAAENHNHNPEIPCAYCLQQLRDAVELVRGLFMEDISLEKNRKFHSWMLFRREQLIRQQCGLLETLIRQYERVEDYSQAALYGLNQANLVKLDDAQNQRLMRVLAKAGRSGEALEWYESYHRKQFAGIETPPNAETTALAEEIRMGSFEQAVASASSVVHNLPESLTPFYNREMEMAQLAKLFNNPACRLINIVGLGGVGKTRLALQAARMKLRSFPDGVFFIPLETITSPDQLISVIGQVIGLVPGDHQDMRTMLLGYLRLKHVLLVLDNFEQLSDGKGILLEILQAAPFTRILLTSRERLDFQAETLVELGGLSYPEAESLEALADISDHQPHAFAALRLFLERASRINPGSVSTRLLDRILSSGSLAGRLSDDDLRELQAVARICKLVDGLPLGIELAASLARDYTFSEIAEEVRRNLDFLQTSMQDLPERQRTLRASFEHSWDLLPESEREVFIRLSIFPSSFSTASAQIVAGAALPWLRRLEHRSLVQRVSYRRYTLHPLLRQFARDKLRQFSRRIEDQTIQAHAEYFCAFLEERAQDIRSARQIEVIKEIDTEFENIHAAWSWAVEHKVISLLQGASFSLMYFLEVRSRWYEGEAYFQSAAASVEKMHPLPEIVLGGLLACQGWFSCRLSNFEQAETLLLRSLTLLENDNEGIARAFAHFGLGFLYVWMSRFKEAWFHLSTAEKVSDAWVKAWASQALTEMVFESGQAGFSDQPFLKTLAQFEEIGEQRGIGRALNYLGNIALANGNHRQAAAYYERMLTTVEQVGDVWGAAAGYSKLGQLASAAGEHQRASLLQRRSLLMLQRIGDQRRSVYALRELAETAYALQRYAEVKTCFSQALELASRLRNLSLVQDIFTGLAAVWLQAGQPERAGALLTLLLSEPVGDQMTANRAARLFEQVKPLLAVDLPAEPDEGAPAPTLWNTVDTFLRAGIPLPDMILAPD